MIKRKPGLKKISFVAHSVGGVVARYAIGKLYRPPRMENVKKFSADASEEGSKGTIAGLEPINFITVASPHLGSRGNKQVSICFLNNNLTNNLRFDRKWLHHVPPINKDQSLHP